MKLQKGGILSPSKTEWNSVVHMVPKSDCRYRPVGNYRQQNSITKDCYQVPNINSFSCLSAREENLFKN